MLISLNWLREYVDIPAEVTTLAARLTLTLIHRSGRARGG